MDTFSVLLDIVIALGAALTFGLLLARLGQSPIIGFLLAGVLIGPYGLGLLRAVSAVRGMAELGVALLLFTIGLEVPWQRLRALGPRGAMAGVLQLAVTALAAALIAVALGLSTREGVVLGLVIALSSTAVVFRVLADRAEIDSVPGRVTVGILLAQDVAVIPFLLLVPMLAGTGAEAGAVQELAGVGLRGVLLVAGVLIVGRTLVPALLAAAAAARQRDLFVILALIFCLGATWAAHAVGLSPVLGAFVAGVVLADTRFAAQMRADMGTLRIGFLALFFVSIGMLADPVWLLRNAGAVAGVILAIVIGKMLLTGLVVRSLRFTTHTALVSGLALAHIGELSFVVAEQAVSQGVIGDELFKLVVSAAVVTLVLAPYFIGGSGLLARWLTLRAAGGVLPVQPSSAPGGAPAGHVIVVGCGPTGLQVISALKGVGTPHLVLELNLRSVDQARERGIDIEYGDASHEEVLRHAGVEAALALVLTVPDPSTAGAIAAAAKTIRPDLPVVARARYARYARQLAESGADCVLDEEHLMGQRLAALTLRLVGLVSEGMAKVPAPDDAVGPRAGEAPSTAYGEE